MRLFGKKRYRLTLTPREAELLWRHIGNQPWSNGCWAVEDDELRDIRRRLPRPAPDKAQLQRLTALAEHELGRLGVPCR